CGAGCSYSERRGPAAARSHAFSTNAGHRRRGGRVRGARVGHAGLCRSRLERRLRTDAAARAAAAEMTTFEDYLRSRAPRKTTMNLPRFRSTAIWVAAAALSACATTTQSNRDLTPGSGAVKVVPFQGSVK